jgi:hypothetical protein
LAQASHHNPERPLYLRAALNRAAPRRIVTKAEEKTVPIITWVVLGLIAGFSASKLINATGESLLMNLVLGIAGAMTGGELFNKFWMAGG